MSFRSRSLTVVKLMTYATVASLAMTGCGKKPLKPEVRIADTNSGAGIDGANATHGNGSWGPGGAPGEENGANGTAMGRGGKNAFGTDGTGSLPNGASLNGVEGGQFVADLDMVHFKYDSADLDSSAKGQLDHHAEWISGHKGVNIQIEGHCDERGTEEYNVALGQRRADTVREYLVGKGIDANSLSTISYGKLRPLSTENTDEAHSNNRRAMFLVYSADSSTPVASAN